MPADQMRGPFAHGLRIQRVQHLPGKPLVMGQRRPPRDQAEKVTPLNRRKPGVEVVRHPRRRDNRHRCGFQMPVQRLGQAERVPVARKVAMGHLSGRMDPRIGAPSRRDPRRVRLQRAERIFHRLLHRRLARLTLPTGKGAAVIVDLQGISGHAFP